MDTQTRSTMASLQEFPWWLLLLEGIGALLVGLFLVISPGMTTLIIIQLLGFYWLFSGILSLVGIFIDDSLWGWKLFGGILGIVAGLIVIRNPLWSAILLRAVLVIILAIQALFQGIVRIVQVFRGGGFGAFALGALNLIIGLLLLGSPLLAALALPWVLGLAIVGGIAAIIGAFRLRSVINHASSQFSV